MDTVMMHYTDKHESAQDRLHVHLNAWCSFIPQWVVNSGDQQPQVLTLVALKQPQTVLLLEQCEAKDVFFLIATAQVSTKQHQSCTEGNRYQDI